MVHEEPHESPILPATHTAYTNFLELDRSLHMRRYFSLKEIRKATDSFNADYIIGLGGFGRVFKGVIDDGATTVAIKRYGPSSYQKFQTEILILSNLMHRNLVSLIGYCDEKDEMILVYEYMELGNLQNHLYNPSILLTWKQRLHICLGAASGLHYLHTGARQVVIHRDVKTANVFLDKELVPKMSDFGMSKVLHSDWDRDETQVTTLVVGTYGYLDPEYFMTSRISVKSDVYSFGVLLFEVLSARTPINPILSRKHVNLIEWGKSCFRKGKLDKIVDSNLKGQIAPKCLHKFVETAVACISEKGIDRPAMGDVIRNLELAVQLQEATAIDQGSPGPWMMTKTNSRGYLKESKYRDVMTSRFTQKDKLLSSSSE